MKQIYLCFSIFILIYNSTLQAKSQLNDSILNEYLKLQKEFSSSACTPNLEETFQKLDRDYRGDGNFIPVLLDEKIDLKTIKSLLPLMKEKNQWIQTQIDQLVKINDLKSVRLDIDRLENNINILLEARREAFFAKNTQSKNEIEQRAEKQFEQLLKELDLLRDKIPFFLSFKFPVDHLKLRAEYEKNKALNTKEGRNKANSVYLYRKIVQDGSFDEDLNHNDAAIRSVFDTVYLSLTSESKRAYLTDNERVDLHYVLNNLDKLVGLKVSNIMLRFEEWKKRSERSLHFYQDLVDGKKIKLSEQSQLQDITAVLEDRSKSLYTLKDFVLNHEAKTYEFWSKRSELLQSLFAIETILYNEVGRMDAPDALERRDVTQVIINRSENKTYNMLSEKDSLLKYLSHDIKMRENRWLNVLFREGEFSFTYFHIPANVRIYCPDMSKTGQFIRRENVRIALELLNKPNAKFSALRYFSRQSMFGHIEMNSLWNDFEAEPEVPGKPVKNPKRIFEMLKRFHYKLLYDFTNKEMAKNFMVVELKGKTYVVDAKNNKQIYYYRNPHQFKYFSLIK